MEPSGRNRWQPAANGDALENGSNRPIRNRWQRTATVSQRMVKRGATIEMMVAPGAGSPVSNRLSELPAANEARPHLRLNHAVLRDLHDASRGVRASPVHHAHGSKLPSRIGETPANDGFFP